MKSYFTPGRVRAQGKAWQIRIMLSQWEKEAGSAAKMADYIHSRLPNQGKKPQGFSR